MTKQSQRIDPLTPDQRRHTMASVHSKHTKPEMKVRSLVHGMGYRYRLHYKDLPGQKFDSATFRQTNKKHGEII